MEEQRLPLEHLVYSEEALLEVLAINKGVLDSLRLDKDFPFIRLDVRHRVYLSGDVQDWLKRHTVKA
jgi:hypothetical protein